MCDAPLKELTEKTWEVCGRGAAFWNPETELCYCDNHRRALRGLQPISKMPEKALRRIQTRQLTER